MPAKPDTAGPPPSAPPPLQDEPTPPTTVAAARAAEDAAVASAGKAGEGQVTPEDIRIEHVTTMASLTPIQLKALVRLNRAFRESHLGNCSMKDALMRVYEEEAAERNRKANGEPEHGAEEPLGRNDGRGFGDTDGQAPRRGI